GLDRVVAVLVDRDLVVVVGDLELRVVGLAAAVDVVEVDAHGADVGQLAEGVAVALATVDLVAPGAPRLAVAGEGAVTAGRARGIGGRRDRLASAAALPGRAVEAARVVELLARDPRVARRHVADVGRVGLLVERVRVRPGAV